jgi:hypothetical protein
VVALRRQGRSTDAQQWMSDHDVDQYDVEEYDADQSGA